MRYFGPFPVIAKIEKVAYKLQLLATAKIHPVFHVSLLKKCTGRLPKSSIPLPLDGQGLELQPQLVLEHHMVKKNKRWHEEVLIKWQALPVEDATWEVYEDMKQMHPNFDLEGKVNLNRETIDRRTEKRGSWHNNSTSKTEATNFP
ncbi:uncharacterized protein [Arachis hypogaea]|uniref:uncharacterized protein n=1 Tax=Arachis hypogaea TaxID=3818 RepID=UPI003B21BA0D